MAMPEQVITGRDITAVMQRRVTRRHSQVCLSLAAAAGEMVTAIRAMAMEVLDTPVRNTGAATTHASLRHRSAVITVLM